MFDAKEIKVVHLEVTSKCNARCPMCLRTKCGGALNHQLPITELSLDDIKAIFPASFLRQLSRIYLCGNYGDPITAKDTLPILYYFKEMNSQINLDIFTNGGARNEKWWRELAPLLDHCRFGIDGLEDTNHLYRRGVNWSTLTKNVHAFIDAGGSAKWDFIVFKHNEHQIDEAKKLSQEWGFSGFQYKKTARFFSNVSSKVKDSQVVLMEDGTLDYCIEMPVNSKFQNSALLTEQKLIQEFGSLENYLDQTSIDCKVLKDKSVYLSAEGLAFPCCWTANQLYPWYFRPKSSPIWDMIEQLPEGIQSLNARRGGIPSIMNGSLFQAFVPESWQCPSVKEGKLKVCAKTCGTGFDPFKAQFRT